ncbi:nucleotidyltransferase domain-containing protein [Shewanella sp. 202IG2-18]|uniref:nucleotidyltransferase family protein n=1 Tax=Parashewanella hymeniacidonis TaxID=2807618 RepID=UPI00195FDF32|nr:nucleotidyltransferase domain-containing protein [Parashewanella hymeniacidonis]MBM7072113.1 nucleotidyltransferase domain-containing protein [Parashewanella hymeniacidonis]
MAHFGLTSTQLNAVLMFLNENQNIRSAWIFGSRATGYYRNNSDIDIAISGAELTQNDISKLKESFELSTIPFSVDIVIKEQITNQHLLEQIEQQGIEILNN